MGFSAGDAVHVRALGSGVVREVRNGDRYLVDIKGRAMVVFVDQLTPVEPVRRRRGGREAAVTVRLPGDRTAAAAGRALDLHGKTVDEAIDALDGFLNQMLLDGQAFVRIIHGRSGGRIKVAVQKRLREMPSVRSYRLDPGNPGVTIVSF